MLDSLRKPFLIVAIVLMDLVVLVELGAGFLLAPRSPSAADLGNLNAQAGVPHDGGISASEILRLRQESKAPPGLAVRSMALLDGLVLFTVGLMGLGLLIPEKVHGRLQGLATLIVSFLVVVGGFSLLLSTFALLMVMVSLFLAAPFGTLVYLAIYGFFDRAGASVTLRSLARRSRASFRSQHTASFAGGKDGVDTSHWCSGLPNRCKTSASCGIRSGLVR